MVITLRIVRISLDHRGATRGTLDSGATIAAWERALMASQKWCFKSERRKRKHVIEVLSQDGEVCIRRRGQKSISAQTTGSIGRIHGRLYYDTRFEELGKWNTIKELGELGELGECCVHPGKALHEIRIPVDGRAEEKLELLHIDLCGSFEDPSQSVVADT